MGVIICHFFRSSGQRSEEKGGVMASDATAQQARARDRNSLCCTYPRRSVQIKYLVRIGYDGMIQRDERQDREEFGKNI